MQASIDPGSPISSNPRWHASVRGGAVYDVAGMSPPAGASRFGIGPAAGHSRAVQAILLGFVLHIGGFPAIQISVDPTSPDKTYPVLQASLTGGVPGDLARIRPPTGISRSAIGPKEGDTLALRAVVFLPGAASWRLGVESTATVAKSTPTDSNALNRKVGNVKQPYDSFIPEQDGCILSFLSVFS